LSSDYVYDSLLNRLLEDDTYTYNYDNNGNLTSKTNKATTATTTYQYDAEDRLVQITTPTDVIQYQYDGFGRRNVRTLNGVVTRYVYDQEDILFEFDENDQIKARYTHGPGIDEPISVDRDTDSDGVFDVTYYYHKDGLGSITAITDAVGNVVQAYVYDSFGKIVNQTGSIENPYTYTGREWDAEAGLYYYRARYYDPSIGRFINGDPIGFAGGDVNFYVYVQNNPVNYIDPDGENFLYKVVDYLLKPGNIEKAASSLERLSRTFDRGTKKSKRSKGEGHEISEEPVLMCPLEGLPGPDKMQPDPEGAPEWPEPYEPEWPKPYEPKWPEPYVPEWPS
jgi:RHS repeat-associated protein